MYLLVCSITSIESLAGFRVLFDYVGARGVFSSINETFSPTGPGKLFKCMTTATRSIIQALFVRGSEALWSKGVQGEERFRRDSCLRNPSPWPAGSMGCRRERPRIPKPS
jgi:hypothetical protein